MTFPNPELARLIELATAELRAPDTYADIDSLTFDPPLTAQEQARLTELRATIESPVSLSVIEWDRIRPELQTLRALRQMGRSAFMALSAAERDRLIYDALTSQTIIDLAILRS